MNYVKQSTKDKRSELNLWVQLPFGKRCFFSGQSVSWKSVGTAGLGDGFGSEKLVGNRSSCFFHPFSTSSALEKLPDTGLPELSTAVRNPNVPWGATESQTLSAVQPEGGSSLAWRVLSLLLEHQLLAFCETSFAARGSIVQSNYVFYSLNLRGSKSALRALSNSNSQTKA